MYVNVLPEYSAERYFLLSEIEQKSMLYFFDEGLSISLDEVQRSSASLQVVFAYILIDCAAIDPSEWEEHIISFAKRVQLCPNYPKECARFVISVDIVISQRSMFKDIERDIQRLFDSNTLKSLGALLYTGISDNIAACPALEKCYDVLELSSPGYSDDKMQLFAILYAESRDALKGLNPTQEPDAAKGVFQVFISSEESSFVDLVSSVKNSLTQERLITSTTEKKTSMWENPIVAIILAIIGYFIVRKVKNYLQTGEF